MGGVLARRHLFWPFPTHDHFDSSRLCLTPYSHQAIHKLNDPLSWEYGITIHEFLWPLELGICRGFTAACSETSGP